MNLKKKHGKIFVIDKYFFFLKVMLDA